jgi:hypothetical protein
MGELSLPLFNKGLMNNLICGSQNKKFKLSHWQWQKRWFDATNKQDLKDYAYFLKHNHWKENCPFVLEWPYLTITDMIKDKLIEQYIDTMLEQAISE